MELLSIPISRYKGQKDAFPEREKLEHSTISTPMITVPWDLVEALMVPYTRPNAPYSLGQKWYLGWDAADLRLAVAPLLLWPDVQRTETAHVFEGGYHELIHDPSGKTLFAEVNDWFFRWRGSTSSYANRYFAKFPPLWQGTQHDPVHAGLDHCAALVTWEDELRRLYDHSKLNKDPLDLVITHSAPDLKCGGGDPMDHHHTLCFHLVQKGFGHLDAAKGHNYGGFRYRAANLVTPVRHIGGDGRLHVIPQPGHVYDHSASHGQ